jgi:zinc protease
MSCMKRSCLVLLLSCAACAWAVVPGPASAAAEGVEPRELTLDNGLRVLLAPDPHAAAVDVSVWYEAGVRYERPPALGISHLFEHLSARGAAPGGTEELRRRIEAEGGISAAYTSADFTCFTHTVPRAALATVLQLEAGRLGLKPTQAMLDQERAQVREETRARARANPLERGIQRLYATAFPTHPYRWAVLGSDDDLRRITLGECADFLQHRYTPDHVLVTIVGDFDPDQAVRELRRGLGAVRRRGESHVPSPEPEPRGERRAVEVADVQAPVVIVGWRVPAGAANDAAALDLISALLSRGSGARLNQWPEGGEPVTRFAQSGRDGRRDATIFWAAAVGRSVDDTAAVERHVIGQVEKLATEPVSGEDLDRARHQVEVTLLFGRQSAHDRGVALGTAEMLTGDWHDADRQLERVRSLTPADLMAAAARTLVAARRTVVWMLPANAAAAGGRP